MTIKSRKHFVCDIQNNWAAFSTLLRLISNVYRHQASDYSMHSRNSTTDHWSLSHTSAAKLINHGKYATCRYICKYVSCRYICTLTGNTVTSLCYIVIYTFIQHHNDTIIKTHEGRKTQEDFFTIIFTSHFIARVRKGSM